MVTCSKCGTQVLGDAAFCVKCGQRLKPTTPPASHIYCAKCGQALPHADGSPGTAETVQSVIPLNYAAPLSYLFGWVSGIVVYFMDKRPAVRFHAVQSIIVFGVLTDWRIYFRAHVQQAFSGIARNKFLPSSRLFPSR